LILLEGFRLPDYPGSELQLDRSPLSVVDTENFTKDDETSNLSAAVGIATVLYNWCPESLTAFLDLDAWFSFTWSLAIQQGESDETNVEIGRVGNQITFGTLDKDGDDWKLMLTYNISMDGLDRGAWIPNPRESMKGDDDITDPVEIDKLSREFARSLVVEKRWTTGKKIRHKFYIEYPHQPSLAVQVTRPLEVHIMCNCSRRKNYIAAVRKVRYGNILLERVPAQRLGCT
jgi:hypothetical protein